MLANDLRRFCIEEDGLTATEYAILLALIIVVVITALRTIGTNLGTSFGLVSFGGENGSQLGGQTQASTDVRF